jgi:CheY-like chemotaxis protein
MCSGECGSRGIQSPLIELGEEHHTENPLKILLAEDNPCDQELMLRMLMYMGFCADIARSGLEVIIALQSRSYDLILMDLEMPVMGGIEATRLIRLFWHERKILIIALASCDQKGDKEACIRAGMDGYLCKPVKREDIEIALNSHGH